MNRLKFHVKKGDNVEVISGNFKGSSGKVLQVLPNKQRVLIEGVRIIKKHLRKSQDNPSGKIVKQMKKFYAHDEENKAKTGDTVRIMETRPLSKLKRWRLVEVLQK